MSAKISTYFAQGGGRNKCLHSKFDILEFFVPVLENIFLENQQKVYHVISAESCLYKILIYLLEIKSYFKLIQSFDENIIIYFENGYFSQ